MSKFIRVEDGDLESTENISKLQNLACIRKPMFNSDELSIDNLIAQTHTCEIELMHIIKTEDQIDNPKDQLSDELKLFTKNVAKEFMQDVLDPFCENTIKFLEKHPEYIIKGLSMNSGVETEKSIAMKELKHMILSSLT